MNSKPSARRLVRAALSVGLLSGASTAALAQTQVTTAASRATASADGAFTATFHGVLQFDAAAYLQPSGGPASVDLRRDGPALGASTSNAEIGHPRQLKGGDLFRRARIGVDGRAPADFDYRLQFDFGGPGAENAGYLYEGWVQYSGLRPLHVRIGAFAPSLGLADANAVSFMPFLDRPSPVDISRNLAGGDSRTAAEAFAYGRTWFAAAAATGRTVGAINTNITVGEPQPHSDQLGFTGRVAFEPVAADGLRVHLGAHGAHVDRPAGPSGSSRLSGYVALNGTAELRVDSTKLINTGNIPARTASAAGAEFAVQKGPLFLASEYERLAVRRRDIDSTPRFAGYYVEGTWFLTGESKRYNPSTAAWDGPVIAHPFKPPAGSPGALELAVRWSHMSLDYHAGAEGTAPAADAVRGGEQSIVAAGLNWYPAALARFMLDYQHVRIDRLSPSASAYATPTGAQIGQTFDAVALRSQVAF